MVLHPGAAGGRHPDDGLVALHLFGTVPMFRRHLHRHRPRPQPMGVREVFMIHVGGTRCVTSRTDTITKIHARITLTVEFIPGCIFIGLFYV